MWVWSDWRATPSVWVPLALAALLYARGLRRLWARAGRGRGVERWRAAAFFGGLAAAGLALLSPLDGAADALFSAHMVQHMALILIAAPLLVLGAPERALPWIPSSRALRLRLGRAGRALARPLGHPVVAAALAGGALWIWHGPVLYDRAVAHEPVHALEHACFLGTAALFWAGIAHRRGPRAARRNGARLLALCVMAVQGGLLGALLTFAGRPLYSSQLATTLAAGRSPLEDQQLAGLIMWVPPSVLYVGVAASLLLGWLREVGRPRASIGVGVGPAAPRRAWR